MRKPRLSRSKIATFVRRHDVVHPAHYIRVVSTILLGFGCLRLFFCWLLFRVCAALLIVFPPAESRGEYINSRAAQTVRSHLPHDVCGARTLLVCNVNYALFIRGCPMWETITASARTMKNTSYPPPTLCVCVMGFLTRQQQYASTADFLTAIRRAARAIAINAGRK